MSHKTLVAIATLALFLGATDAGARGSGHLSFSSGGLRGLRQIGSTRTGHATRYNGITNPLFQHSGSLAVGPSYVAPGAPLYTSGPTYTAPSAPLYGTLSAGAIGTIKSVSQSQSTTAKGTVTNKITATGTLEKVSLSRTVTALGTVTNKETVAAVAPSTTTAPAATPAATPTTPKPSTSSSTSTASHKPGKAPKQATTKLASDHTAGSKGASSGGTGLIFRRIRCEFAGLCE